VTAPAIGARNAKRGRKHLARRPPLEPAAYEVRCGAPLRRCSGAMIWSGRIAARNITLIYSTGHSSGFTEISAGGRLRAPRLGRADRAFAVRALRRPQAQSPGAGACDSWAANRRMYQFCGSLRRADRPLPQVTPTPQATHRAARFGPANRRHGRPRRREEHDFCCASCARNRRPGRDPRPRRTHRRRLIHPLKRGAARARRTR
jgi:hypothetical protein